MKKIIFVVFFLGIALNNLRSQGAEAQLGVLNGLIAAFKQAEVEQDAVKMAKLSKQIENIKKTYEITSDIYDYYEQTVDVVETVSNTIKTSVEVKEFFNYLFEISDLYAKYGIGYSINSLYDLDKYLNPTEQEMYLGRIKNIYESSLDIAGDMKMIISNKADGGASATEYQRFTEVNKLNKDMKVMLQRMRQAVYTMMYLVPQRNQIANSNIELKKSLYSYETYAK